MFRNPFQKTAADPRSGSPTVLTGPRVARHSSSWSALLKHLHSETGLRVLDIGPTSPTNINFLTSMGQSVYMADLVFEAHKPEWMKKPADAKSEAKFDVEGFLEHNLDFSGREFDVVLLWTTLDYLPVALVTPVIHRLKSCMKPGGKVLVLFHNKATGENTAYCRYHLTDTDAIETQGSANIPIQQVFTNRNMEKAFDGYAGCKFFLAKDNLYEALITR